MKAQIEINLDNDAFQPSAGPELARIFRNLANDLDGFVDGRYGAELPSACRIADINGNRVGRFEIEEDEIVEHLSTMIDGDDNHYNE